MTSEFIFSLVSMQAEKVTIDGYQFVPKNCEFSLRQAAANQPICVDICFDERLEYYCGVSD